MYFHFSQKLDLAACQCCVYLASNLALYVLRDVGVQGCCCCSYVLSPSPALSKQLTFKGFLKYVYTPLPRQVKTGSSFRSLSVCFQSLSPSLQSNYFCWQPATFARFQMDLVSLSLGMGAFECMPLQDCAVVAAASAFHLVQHPHKPLKSHAPKIAAIGPLSFHTFASCSFMGGNFIDCFCHI